MAWMKEGLGDKKTHDRGVHCLTLGSVSKGLGHQGQLLRGAGLEQHLEGRIEDESAEQG